MKGGRIRVYVENTLDLEVGDTMYDVGGMALYSWGCAGARFRHVVWKAAAN